MSRIKSQDGPAADAWQTIASCYVVAKAKLRPTPVPVSQRESKPTTLGHEMSAEEQKLFEVSAAQNADALADYLRQVALHLQRLNCTSATDIAHYCCCERNVLLDIHDELERASPRPTSLVQLAVQFALDPRVTITVPLSQIRIERAEQGWTIHISPPHLFLPLDLIPAQVVLDPIAVHLLKFLEAENRDLFALKGFVETLLENLPARDRVESAQSGRRTGTLLTSQLDIDHVHSVIRFNDKMLPVNPLAICLIETLLSTGEGWVSSKELMERNSMLEGARLDRVVRSLSPLGDIVQSKPGGGYRLNPDILA